MGDYVSSVALEKLQSDLNKLSMSLHEIYNLMNADMSNLGADWRDGKYEEFVSGYKPQINKCEDIANNYEEWCKRVLTPMIEKVKIVEDGDVGGPSSSFPSSSGSGDGLPISGGAPSPNKFGFNTGKKKSDSFRAASQRVQEMAEEHKKEAAAIAWAKKSGDSGADIPGTDRTTRPAINMMNALLNGRGR